MQQTDSPVPSLPPKNASLSKLPAASEATSDAVSSEKTLPASLPEGPRKVGLCLQGGGAHGAYTWGVLDRLLDEEELIIEGISGTSAGAMNAVVFVDGYLKGGKEGAKKALRVFWEEVSNLGKLSPVQHAPFQRLFGQWNMDWFPGYTVYEAFSRLFSPYETNPFNLNPFKELVSRLIDFEAVRQNEQIKLFITATSVTTGKGKVFHTHEITPDVLMASACLPFLFQAVEIGDDCYWDGGFSGNPSIWPLAYNCKSCDLIVIEINPVKRKQKPISGSDIVNRVNEISFNAGLIAEMRAIHFVNRLMAQNNLPSDRYRQLNMHVIASTEEMLRLNASSKRNASREFFNYLHGLGEDAADKWLAGNLSKIGIPGSGIDIAKTFLF